MLKVSMTGGQIGGGTSTKARVSRFGEIALRESLILELDLDDCRCVSVMD